MTDEITHLSDYRTPVTYTLTITHRWDGTIEATVHDVSDDPECRRRVVDALRRVVAAFARAEERTSAP